MGGMSGGGASSSIDWPSDREILIKNKIRRGIGIGRFKFCPTCLKDDNKKSLGFCSECWVNVCREFLICPVCHESTIKVEEVNFYTPDLILMGYSNLYPDKTVPANLPTTSVVPKHSKIYCSDKCQGIAKSRRWRKEKPEKKQMSELKYLKYVDKENKKAKNEEKEARRLKGINET